jgi:hypothetical protein
MYKDNFKFFLENGILDDVDYYIIINDKNSLTIPKKNNIYIYYRENKGYDFGAYSYALKKIDKIYDYYFFINTSVRGPHLFNKKDKWTNYFLRLFHKNVKVVGTTINIFPYNIYTEYNLDKIYNKKEPFVHVQSMFFCIDKEYLKYLQSINFFNEEELNKAPNINYVIATREIGLSQYALKNGWNINCLLPKYQNINYLDIKNDINPSSIHGDPYYFNSYFNNTINPYEVIFFKTNRLY